MNKQNITTFSIGIFTDGTMDVLGFIYKGVLRGVIIKRLFQKKVIGFSWFKSNQFYNNVDEFPRFKLHHSIEKIRQKTGVKIRTQNVLEFLEESTDLPDLYLKQKEFIDAGRRSVIIEKYSRREVLRNYLNISDRDEFNLLLVLSKKYKCVVKEFPCCSSNDMGDILGDYCSVMIPLNKERNKPGVHCKLCLFTAMQQFLQMLAHKFHKRVSDELETIVNKIN